jgi:5-methyltetrahydrofolate--homocysteine methyltransferase
MDEIAGRFATQASLPLVFDSTEPGVVEAGLRHHGGKAILNSANLEEGDGEGKRMDRVFSLAREYGAAVICLTIDEEGQARDADWKLRVAKRIYDIAIERYGVEPTDLIFDALTFPSPPVTTTSVATRWRRSKRSGGSRWSCRAHRRSSACRTSRSDSSPRPATC